MKRYKYILLLLIVSVISSCNSDIFVDNDDLPDRVNITIDGDGGQWSAPISRKGLTAVYINPVSSASKLYYKYYGLDGKPADENTPISEISSIQYENPCQHYAIGFNGDMGYITSYYNASSENYISILLEYDYGVTKQINITIKEGKHLELQYCHLSGNPVIEKDFDSITRRESFTNNSSIEQSFFFSPYRDATCGDQVIPEDEWARGLSFNLPMPVFHDGDWYIIEYPDIVLGHKRKLTPPHYFDEVKVPVPASKKAIVSYTVNYSRATQNGRLELCNREINGYCEENVKWTAVYPTSFSYEVTYE